MKSKIKAKHDSHRVCLGAITILHLSDIQFGENHRFGLRLSALSDEPDVAAHQVGSGTLLVRDEEGNFSFVHQSVQEWLVALKASDEIQKGIVSGVLSIREMSGLMVDFLIGLSKKETLEKWAQNVLSSEELGENVRKNALLVLDKLKTEIQVPLRMEGEDLAGKDFSNRDLSCAVMAYANLRFARLTGTNLNKAILKGAKLEHADLCRANLAGADLSETNLSQSNLLGADLRSARMKNAVLHRAKLVGAKLDPSVLSKCDIFGAAMLEEGDLLPWINEASECYAVAWGKIKTAGIIATGHSNGSVRIWERDSGKEITCFKGHEGSVNSVAFSPDGKVLATGSADKTVRLWDPGSGKGIGILKGHEGTVRSVAFSPDGKVLATGSYDNTVRLWDTKSGSCMAVLGLLPEGWVAFTPDGRYKMGGEVAGNFWYSIALCRFEPGELDPYIPNLKRLSEDEPLVIT